MNLEDYFISAVGKNNRFIGDDGAVVGDFIYSKDAFFENIHFKRQWLTPEQIAYRSMMVNLSDAVAMNARPIYALLAVAMPPNIKKNHIRQLTSGFISAASAYNVAIIGGDTIENSKLDITVTIISKSSKPLLRSGLKENHLVAYTGRLGNCQKELKKLLRGGKIHTKSKFVNITLRDRFIAKSRRFLKCGLDISDGLFSDLGKLSSVNRLGFNFIKSIGKNIGCSGEEYEMLVGFDHRDKKAVLRRAKQTRTPLTIIAKAKRNKYTNRCKSNHFKRPL